MLDIIIQARTIYEHDRLEEIEPPLCHRGTYRQLAVKSPKSLDDNPTSKLIPFEKHKLISLS